jgi:hypothetical protein
MKLNINQRNATIRRGGHKNTKSAEADTKWLFIECFGEI